MPMTFKQILSKTPLNRIKKAESVKIIEVKVRKNPEGYPMVVAKTKSLRTSKDKPKKPAAIVPYVTTIEIYPKGYVIVSCSCDDFMYTWEVALHMKGAARIEFSNAEMPDTRNPARIPGCCGHIVKLGEFLRDKGKL